MRWIGLGALVLSACSLAACGGSTTSGGSGGSGGSAGTAGSGGAGGTVGGCNCSTGYHCGILKGTWTCIPDGTAGAGGSAGTAGTGGTAATECSAALKAGASLGGADVGFKTIPASGGQNAMLGAVQVDNLSLKVSGGSVLEFKWVGPDLTTSFQPGESVAFGRDNGWDYVAGMSALAAARRDFDFVAPQEIQPMPLLSGPHLAYGAECTFKEASGGCGQPPGTVTLLNVEATTGAGVVSIGQGKTKKFMDWQIHNDSSAQYPGYGSGTCIVEAGFASVVTVLGPSPINGGP